MKGALLAAGLLCAALGLALGYAPRRALPWAFAALVAAAIVGATIGLDARWSDSLLLGCWASVVLIALGVHLCRLPGWLAVAMAADVGLLTGAVTGWQPGLAVLALALLALPAAWVVGSGRGIAVKVVASWVVAVALLAAALPFVATPGYAPDHME